MYSYRNTRAHNSILVNGMTQKIGTEGYGWIPRWYEGEKIAYMVGDASNAYGKVTSPLWLKRGELSGTQYTPEKDGMRTSWICSAVISSNWELPEFCDL